MLWFIVWTLLVVGAGVVLFRLGRDLWRRATRFGAEAERAAQVLDRLAEQIEAAEAASRLTVPAPVELEDTGPAQARLALARAAKERRRQAREVRHQAAYARWRAFTH